MPLKVVNSSLKAFLYEAEMREIHADGFKACGYGWGRPDAGCGSHSK